MNNHPYDYSSAASTLIGSGEPMSPADFKKLQEEARQQQEARMNAHIAAQVKTRRDRLAERIFASLVTGYGQGPIDEEVMIDRALALTDALIAELDK